MSSNKLRALIDADGVLAAFDTHFYNRVIENGWKFDIDHPAKQIKRFFTDHIPNKHHRNLARKMVDGGGWFRDLPVIDGAQDGMAKLDKLVDEVWIVSKPLDADRTCMDDKRYWMELHFPAFVDRLILAPDKSLIKGDFLLDDAPKEKWFARADWTPVIYSQPFNSHEGSPLYNLPHYDWSKPIEELLELAMENRNKQ